MWSIEKENESLFLTILGQRATDPITKKGYGEIVAVSRGKSGEEITLKFKNSKNGRHLQRHMFKASEGSEELTDTSSNKQFINILNQLLGKETTCPPAKRKRTGKERSWAEGDMVERPMEGEEQEVMQNYVGEKRIKLSQLKPAPPCFRLREIDDVWVSKLTGALLSSALQCTILPVMMIPMATQETEEAEEDCEKYWTLGGNHLVTAMKNVEQDQSVICHVYKDLTQEECLKVAANNNRKGKTLPITFQDRVAIARKLQEEGCQDLAKKLKEVLGEIEHKEYKDSVSTIVSVARYSPENYILFQNLAKDSGKSIHQKLFKLLQPESEETITKTLKTALEIGLGQACSWLTDNKAMSALKRVFTREVGESSWEDAEKNHPNRSKVLMEYKGSISQRKFVPDEVLNFCSMSKETDDVVDIQVKIELKKNGRIVQLNGKLKELAESFQEKMKKEIRKEDVVFEE